MTDTAVSFNTRAARAMRAAFEAEQTGALLCESEEAKRLVFFEAGHLVGARSDRPGERLGEILVREGRVSRAQLEEATGFIRSGRKLGQILVERGYLRSGEIERYVRIQIIEIASAMLLSSSERLVFSESTPVDAVTLSPVSIGDVFLEASKSLTDVELYRENVLIDDYVLAQTEDAVALSPGMNFTTEEACVVDLVDGGRTVSEILSLSPLGLEGTVRLLVALHQSGIVALKERRTEEKPAEPAPASAATTQIHPLERELIEIGNEMQFQNHWQVLGLGRDAGYAEIDRAYRERLARFDGENYREISEPELVEKLSFVKSRLKEAFVTLSSKTSTNVYDRLVHREDQYQEKKESWEQIPSAPAEPSSWDRPKNPEEGKTLFAQAKRAFRENDFWRAIELCRASIEASGDNDPDKFHLLGKALSENPRWRKDAEQSLQIAHKLKPWEPKYLVALGKLYDKEGLHQRAQRIYDQVRAIDPTYSIEEGAKRAAEDLE